MVTESREAIERKSCPHVRWTGQACLTTFFLNGKEAAAWNQLTGEALHATAEDDSEFQAPEAKKVFRGGGCPEAATGYRGPD